MSGFALLFDTDNPVRPSDHEFDVLAGWVTQFKDLKAVKHTAAGRNCAAAKFDTTSSLHRGFVVDEQTGSWLAAVGTVCERDQNPPDGHLGGLLARYLEQGETVFQHLDGQFALVLYHKPLEKLLVVTDPFGAVSVFWARRGSKTYVATSALAVARAVKATPGQPGIYFFLTSGSVFGSYTLWNEVERQLPATIMAFSSAGPAASTYWAPGANPAVAGLSLPETEEYVLETMSSLFKNCLAREEKGWADLTGGFDSRLVAMFMDLCALPFKGICQGPDESVDVQLAAAISNKLGWDYQSTTLPDTWGQQRFHYLPRALGQGDGHAEVFKVARIIHSQEQRALQFQTSVWGLGGEVWRGFFWKQEFNQAGQSPVVNYDRLLNYRVLHPIAAEVFSDPSGLAGSRQELKALLKSVGDRYGDLPNTAKLDCIYAYKNTGHTGAYTSAVMGQQRAISPLFFKDAFTCAFSTNYRWRNQSRLVRRLLERVNPVLAGFETSSGGPALPMRLTNAHKFHRYWRNIGLSLARKGFRQLLGRSLIPEPRTEFDAYPLHRWRRETLACLEAEKMLDYAQLYSAKLYRPQAWDNFIRQAKTDTFSQETFLSRAITVEMALRAVGTAL